ncbi:hypothetical protein FOL47_001715 [Perkinsus chesapeaki]|uniref:Sphingomyelin synthase-like domain-containing protein n=1 Tax=Perkinsus chesapeaki TaxID=330153 RepID=A0A7J6MIN1_PERCH|nr:hypothetical protein FOL47_001715 [Perkinsus chesapeaki]
MAYAATARCSTRVGVCHPCYLRNMAGITTPRSNDARLVCKVRAQVKANWMVFRVAWPWFVVALLLLLMHGWAVGLVSLLEFRYNLLGKQSDVLVDFGYMLVPAIEVYPAGGICTWLLILLTTWSVGSLTVITITRPRPGITIIGILWRTVFVCVLGFTLRSISFLVTLLPTPWPECQEYFMKPLTVSDVLSLIHSTSGCGDLIFSGHTLCGMACLLAVAHYSTNWIINIPGWVLFLGEIVAILAERAHYSVDIVVALFTTPMLWICFYHFFPKDPSTRIAFWKDQPRYEDYDRDASITAEDSHGAC